MPENSSKSEIEVRVRNSDLSKFRKSVLLATIQIPRGKVATYGYIAKAIDCRSAQAVGQALRHNPFAPDVPCHRIVNSKLQLHGFHGQQDEKALKRKRELLQNEGVIFLDHNTISPTSAKN